MEAQRLLYTASVRLRTRDYAGSRSSALEAMQLDPSIVGAELVIAICDVFLAVESSGGSPNWYSILKLEPFTENDDLIVEQFKNLITLLSPSRNNYSHGYEAYKLVREAFRVLSSEEKKLKYDEELRAKCAEAVEVKEDEEIKVVDEGFYTMCPFCYWIYEYERVYVDCCLRCQNCRRGFHGVEIQWPPPGEAGSNCLVGFMPLGVHVEEGKKSAGCENVSGPKWVEISDDEDVELKNDPVGKGQNGARESELQPGGRVVGVAQGSNVRGRGGRRKTVARNTKKVMGRGIPRSRIEAEMDSLDRMEAKTGEGSSAGGGKGAPSSGNVDGGVEFMDWDDDLMVCLEDL